MLKEKLYNCKAYFLNSVPFSYKAISRLFYSLKLILVFFLFNVHQSYSQHILWYREFDSDGADYPKAVATDSEGNIVVAGYTIQGNSRKSLIVKYNSTGYTL